MTTHLVPQPSKTPPVRPPVPTRPTRARLTSRTLGLLGLGWALAYVPVHVYWALGGLSAAVGITGQQEGSKSRTGVPAS